MTKQTLAFKARSYPLALSNHVDYDGEVGDWWEYNDIQGFKQKVAQELAGDVNKTLDIDASSHGGSFHEGVAIYSYMKSLPNPIVFNIHGFAGSALTLISCGADIVTINTGGSFFIHQASGGGFGNADFIHDMSVNIENANTSMVEIYALKTGVSKERIRALMSDETDLLATEALALGFVDIIRT